MKESGMSEKEILKEMSKEVSMKVFTWKNKKHETDTVMSPIDSVKYMKMFLQAGFMVMDPFTGDVKAWVGGIDHTFFQYDHVNIDTRRQVGSTIKPHLYTLAIDSGFDPCGTVSTSPQSFPGFHPNPYDAGGSEYGPIPMKKALAKSINNAALYLLNQVGINAFVDFVHRCGKHRQGACGSTGGFQYFPVRNAVVLYHVSHTGYEHPPDLHYQNRRQERQPDQKLCSPAERDH